MTRLLAATLVCIALLAVPVQADEAQVRLDIQQMHHELQIFRREMRLEFQRQTHQQDIHSLRNEEQHLVAEMHRLGNEHRTTPYPERVRKDWEEVKRTVQQVREDRVKLQTRLKELHTAIDVLKVER